MFPLRPDLGYNRKNRFRRHSMLTHLSISNYTIVASLEVELRPGMTVITGETGAGKSIMLDALGLCLGDRADPKAVRHGAARAEVSATFDLSAVPAARAWLDARDLADEHELILRRVVTSEGRSRAYINGRPATLQDCTALGEHLIDIHSQHAHQSLLRRAVQRELLDAYAGHTRLAHSIEQTASEWLRGRRELELLTSARDEQTARAQLLAYQVEELEQLDFGPGELSALEEELQRLENATGILESAQGALALCEAQESGTRRALQLLDPALHPGKAPGDARELLDSAAIQISEARDEIRHYLDTVEIDPQRQVEVQQRLAAIYDVARKHRVQPERLTELQSDLGSELAGLAGGGQRIEALEAETAALQERYQRDAATLGKQRRKAARALQKKALEILATLAMEHCRLEIALRPRDSADPHPHGTEEVELLVSTNPGGEPQPLGRIASGGELSRISLAIQVVTASAGSVPGMVFDEVDVGIGGAVAEVVGRLLQQLAKNAQVLCVTHLPQVAAQGQHHLLVSKTGDSQGVETSLTELAGEAKTREIARMLGGLKVTKQTLAHAREMLENA